MHDSDLIAGLRERLAEAGLSGSFLVRDLGTGEEIGIDPDRAYPIASLVKIPLAIAVLEAIHDGRIDGAAVHEITPPEHPDPASVGIGKFAHPVRIAVDDLLYLAIAISDNAAADALFGLVPPAEVDRALAAAGIGGIAVRHPMSELDSVLPADRLGPYEFRFTHAIAAGARTPGGGHPVAQLDLTRANVGTAHALADLLEALWRPSALPPTVAAGVRALMRGGVLQRRLGPDFISDSTVWASKSGTLLNLRHDAGVVEHEDGEAFAVVALTESAVPASAQPAAEALMGRVARALHDQLRDR